MKVGVLGGGQLGWMLARAGDPLGHPLPVPRPVAGGAGRRARASSSWARTTTRRRSTASRTGSRSSPTSSRTSPSAPRGASAARARVFPPPQALEVSQDRLGEKRFFESAGIPVPPWRPVASLAELDARRRGAGVPRRAQDAAARLRRQGTARHPGARLTSRGRGRSWARRPWSSRASCASTASCRSSPSGDRTARPPAIRSSRTSTRAASCGGAWRPRRGVSAGAPGPGRGARAPGPRDARLRGRARDRALPGRRPAPRQRDGAARPQLGALDDRGGGDEPVREPPARGRGPPARHDGGARRERDAEPDRRAPGSGSGARGPGRASPPLREGPAPRPEARPRDPPGGRPGRARPAARPGSSP